MKSGRESCKTILNLKQKRILKVDYIRMMRSTPREGDSATQRLFVRRYFT